MSDPSPDFVQVAADGAILVRVQSSIYGVDSVATALHRFTDRCAVHLQRDDGDWLTCRLEPLRPVHDPHRLGQELANELVDAMLRTRLRQETEPIRRLLLAQAFSHTALIHPEYDDAAPHEDPRRIAAPDSAFLKHND